MSFSPDGQTLATGAGYTAQLWDAETRQRRGVPLKHLGSVESVAFSPDGRTLATSSSCVLSDRDTDSDGVSLWDTNTGWLRGEPLKINSDVVVVSFSPDGRTLATAGSDAVCLWDVSPPVPDDPKRVWLSVEVRTGRTFENGLVRPLTQTEWLERKRRLDALGGDCLRRTWDDLTEAELAEVRTPPAVAVVTVAEQAETVAVAAEPDRPLTAPSDPPVSSPQPTGDFPAGTAPPSHEPQARASQPSSSVATDRTILWVVAAYAGLAALLAAIAGAARRTTRTEHDRQGTSGDSRSGNSSAADSL